MTKVACFFALLIAFTTFHTTVWAAEPATNQQQTNAKTQKGKQNKTTSAEEDAFNRKAHEAQNKGNPNPPSTLSATEFGLPPNNTLSSQYGVFRVYRKDGTAQTVPLDYKLNPQTDKFTRFHYGVDVRSKDASGEVKKLPFTTPVSGTVRVLDDKTNTIEVKTDYGTTYVFRHASEVKVKNGQKVNQGDTIGVTGNTSPTKVPVHLHVEVLERNPSELGKRYPKDSGSNFDLTDASTHYKNHGSLYLDPGEDLRGEEGRKRNELQQLKSMVDKGSVNRDKLSPDVRKELEQFETNQKIVGDSVKLKSNRSTTENSSSNASTPPTKPGGILLDKAASFLGDLNDITGAVFDAKTQQVILIGKKNSLSPPMDKDHFAVALRAIYSGEAPAVSIDPTENPNVMQVRYFGQIANTDFGNILFEADRILKI